MDYRYTKHQVARGALPDGQDHKRILLVKNVSTLRATYQIRMLTFLASEAGKTLVIVVPSHFILHPSLRILIDEFPRAIQIQKSK